MRSPAVAFAWEFGQQLRWGLIGIAGYALVVVTCTSLIFGPGPLLDPESSPGLAVAVVVPASLLFMFFLAVFSFGLAGDLAARQSIYPARMFTLPVTSAALAGWPMLYGTAAIAILAQATARLALPRFGLDVPLIWPGLLAAAVLAWLQALMWMPYGLRGLRVIVAVPCLAALDVVGFLAFEWYVPEPLLVALLLPQLPLAYLTACFAVGRARRGDVPDWRGLFAGLGRIADLLPRRRDRFPSPARAQAWFERRRHGWSLPAVVGILLPFELALLTIADDRPRLVFYTLLFVLLTPPLMAGFAASMVATSRPEAHDAWGVGPFDATRPLTAAALVAARLQAAIWSTLVAWLLVVVAVPIGLGLSRTWPVVIERTAEWIVAEGALRAFAIGLLAFLALVGLTWKQLVQNLSIGLSGREWVIKSSVLLALLYLIIFGPMAGWLVSLFVMALVTDAMPWVAGAVVCVKLSAAAWTGTRLRGQRLLRDRLLVTIAAGWLLAVLALYFLLGWLVTTPLIPRSLLVLVAVLAIPLARLGAAPLALAWNRHR